MGLWDEAVQVNPVWSQGHLTVDEGQGQGAVTGEAGCEDGAGPQGKEGEQLLQVGERKRTHISSLQGATTSS